jgi:hypothetical protein
MGILRGRGDDDTDVQRLRMREKLSVRDKIASERDGRSVATVHNALVGIRDGFALESLTG